MPSVPLPKAARGAVFVALLIALVAGVSVRSGPIMLLGVCLVAILSAAGIWLRRVWSAYGFALLLALSILAMLFFALTGQSAGNVFQILVSIVIYTAIAGLFLLAGLSLKAAGAQLGSPIPWVLIALLFSAPFVFFRPVSVSTGSMEDTLLIGDFVLVNRFPAHLVDGDLVAFHDPKDHRQIAIQRVVGLPADHRQKYSVKADAHNSLPELIDPADIVGKPKFIYDSLAPDPADINPQRDLSQPTHPPLRRWNRVFKTL